MSQAFCPTIFLICFILIWQKEVLYTVKQLYILFYIVFIIFIWVLLFVMVVCHMCHLLALGPSCLLSSVVLCPHAGTPSSPEAAKKLSPSKLWCSVTSLKFVTYSMKLTWPPHKAFLCSCALPWIALSSPWLSGWGWKRVKLKCYATPHSYGWSPL